jgi:hypothetical protein
VSERIRSDSLFEEEESSPLILPGSSSRQRHDRGPRLTPRDLACLLWTAEQYAIRLDQLQRLLLRHTPEQDRHKLKPGTDRLSLERTYDTLERWRKLGLIEHDAILNGDQLWIWLSRHGLREIDSPFSYGNGKPASLRIPHLYYINQVRLAVETRRPEDSWVSERALRHQQGRRMKGASLPHTPDGLSMTRNGKKTAIEVEWSTKDEEPLDDTLYELATTYKSVWYFAAGATSQMLQQHLAALSPELQKPFVLYQLGDYGHEYGIA